MDDLELQDEPLQIRLMDYDTYSANDAIGKVYLDLNPLLINLSSKGKGSQFISLSCQKEFYLLI
jgi:Ca2+-dependent lipid-binding protein